MDIKAEKAKLKMLLASNMFSWFEKRTFRKRLAALDAMDGGPGSGNFGHKGRPGQVGGSGEGEGSAPDKGVKRTDYGSHDWGSTAVKHPSGDAKKNTEKRQQMKDYASKVNGIQKKRISDEDIQPMANQLAAQKRKELLDTIVHSDMTSEQKIAAYNALKDDFAKIEAESIEQVKSEQRQIDALYSKATYGYNESDVLPIIDKPHSIEDDVLAVNPEYSGSNGASVPEQYKNNCWSCSLAFCLRQNGFDVRSVPDLDGMKFSDVEKMFNDADKAVFEGHESTSGHHYITESAVAKMKEWGDGATAYVSATSRPIPGHKAQFGHAYNMCNRGGVIYFIDTQDGSIWSDKGVGDKVDGGEMERGYMPTLKMLRTDKATTTGRIIEGVDLA